jgi:hypothetical protein
MSDWSLTPEPVSPATRSKRTEDWHRRASVRRSDMRRKFGNGPEGTTCRDCVYLIRVRPGANSFLKCEKYGISGSDASDWRAKWPACGAYVADLNHLPSM